MTKKPLVILQPSGRRGKIKHGLNLREAARQLGVEIESLCAENATCGKCKVVIEEGTFERYGLTSSQKHLSPPSQEETDYFTRRPRMMAANNWEIGQVRLACQAQVQGDVLVFVPEESRGSKQIVRKSATAREIEIKPSIRKYFVEMIPPTLADPHADWERLSKSLVEAMALIRRGEKNLPLAEELSIDFHCLRTLGDTLREGEWRVTVSLWQDREVMRVQPGYVPENIGAAIDIGSTTIALYLCDLDTGEILAAESDMNPQIVYGEDVMSRIQYATSKPEGLHRLNQAIIKTVNQLLKKAIRTANKARKVFEIPVEPVELVDIMEIVFVGNTTMHHLCLGLPPDHLGRAPYVPLLHKALDVKARELGLEINPSGNIHFLPTIASFIGADTSGVLIAEAPHHQDETWLIIDVGTNAELVLGNSKGLICTSTPTGPALEGAHIEHGMRAAPNAVERVKIDDSKLEPRYKIIGEDEWNQGKSRGLCGSAIIDLVAEMFRVGILDARGKFNAKARSKRIREGESGLEYVVVRGKETSIGRDITISQRDIRQIQLAKGALYVAARTLLKQAGLERPDKLILAGGFGSIIDKTNAMIIGMIPDMPLESVYAVGNAAGDGARIALLNLDRRHEAEELARSVGRYELPTDPEFQKQFMLAMNFPHMTDPFPHVEHLLPDWEVDPMAKKLSIKKSHTGKQKPKKRAVKKSS